MDLDIFLEILVFFRFSISKVEFIYIEELIFVEGDDSKFDILLESMIVKEGELVKFSCRVSGIEFIGKMFYERDGKN